MTVLHVHIHTRLIQQLYFSLFSCYLSTFLFKGMINIKLLQRCDDFERGRESIRILKDGCFEAMTFLFFAGIVVVNKNTSQCC